MDHFLVVNEAFSSLRTGNVILDIILASLITSFMAYVMTQDWKEWYEYLFTQDRNKYQFKTVINRTKNQPQRNREAACLCYAVIEEYVDSRMADIDTYDKKMFVSHKKGIQLYIDIDECKDGQVIFFPKNSFELDNMMFVIKEPKKETKGKVVRKENNEEEEENEINEATFDDLVIHHHSQEDLEQFMRKAMQFVTDKHKINDEDQVKFLYNYRAENYIKQNVYRSKLIPRQFDHMCIPSKEIKTLKNLCSNFLHKNGVYAPELQKPYSMTLLFTGPPGNGKTAAIQTLIQYFNIKKVNVIPSISIFSKDSEFRDIFFNDSSEDLEMIVFEELDAGDTGKILKKRSEKMKHEEDEKWDGVAKKSKKSRRKSEDSDYVTFSSSCNDFSLTTWLDTFNGLMTLNNRIIILTTNHIEYLDPAIYRRKRVTKVVHFGHITKESVKSFMSKFWKVPDFSWSELLPSFCEKTFCHALLWDVKEMYEPKTALDFLKCLEQELQMEKQTLQKTKTLS